MQKVQNLARQIYDKWSRLLHNVNTSYNENTTKEEQYRRFREKQSKYEVNRDDPVEVGKSNLVSGSGDRDIIRSRAGIVLP